MILLQLFDLCRCLISRNTLKYRNVFYFFSMTKFKNLIRALPFFILLLPLFFVFHGFVFYYDSVPLNDSFVLLFEYLSLAIVLVGIFWLFFRDLLKASITGFFLLAYFFFFGNMQDVLKHYLPGTVFTQYRFTLSFGFLLFLILLYRLKKIKTPLFKLIAYLNILLIALILFDVVWLALKVPATKKKHEFNLSAEGFLPCDTCRYPDIYYIVPDQYTGNPALKELFHFDNSKFESELEGRGFFVCKKSSSNYNLTPFSIASTLNMDYLKLKAGRQNYSTVSYSYEVIRNSRVLKFLKASGYQFYNYSIFDFTGQPAHKYTAFLPYGIALITSSTLLDRLKIDLRPAAEKGRFGKALQEKLLYEYKNFNDTILNLTNALTAKAMSSPKFVYTHLIMPHYPYYFDSKGQALPLEKLFNLKNTTSNDYVEYLQYSNKKLLQLIDHILMVSPKPPIIVLLADHGFRQIHSEADHRYDFINLNAVYFPNGNYDQMFDSIKNVNEFRVIFNSFFGQKLPLLRDSSTNVMWDQPVN